MKRRPLRYTVSYVWMCVPETMQTTTSETERNREREKKPDFCISLYISVLQCGGELLKHTHTQIVTVYYIMSTMKRKWSDANPHTHTHTLRALVVNCTPVSALSMSSYLWLYANEMLILVLPPEEMDDNQNLPPIFTLLSSSRLSPDFPRGGCHKKRKTN